jgi:hypothetical protein
MPAPRRRRVKTWFDVAPSHHEGWGNGAYRDRTGDLRLAKPALSQLS